MICAHPDIIASMSLTIGFVLMTLISSSMTQSFRSILFTASNHVKYQCNSVCCSPPIAIAVANMQACQIACLMDDSCLTITFDASTNACQRFADSPHQFGTMLVQANVITMTVVGGKPVPSCKSNPRIVSRADRVDPNRNLIVTFFCFQ